MRTSLRDRLVAAAFTVLLFTAVRNVPVFALVVAPVALGTLAAGRAPRASAPSARARVAAWSTVAALAACSVALATAVWRAAPAAEAALPVAPVRALLAQARTQPRVFCEDFAWCSLFLLEPGAARFYMDGRCDPYPASMWRDYADVRDGSPRWAATIARERIDALLVRRDGALDSLLAERPRMWRRIASDRLARLYVKPALLDGGDDGARRAPAAAALRADSPAEAAERAPDAAAQRLLDAVEQREAQRERQAERERHEQRVTRPDPPRDQRDDGEVDQVEREADFTETHEGRMLQQP